MSASNRPPPGHRDGPSYGHSSEHPYKPSSEPSSEPSSGHWAELAIGDLRLLLAQSAVHTLEMAQDVVQSDVPPGWLLRGAGESYPVHCVDPDLRPLDQLPPTRKICAVLRAGGVRFGILVDAVRTREKHALRPSPLPAALSGSRAIVESLMVGSDGIGCLSTPERLYQALEEQGSRAFPVPAPERRWAGAG